MEKIDLLSWTSSGNTLLQRARKIILSAQSEKVRELAVRIPMTILNSDISIKVVFAGQYGAGKSSILKALTGRDDIAVGAGITTEEPHTYEWDGVTVIDTPGIHTQLRPDHDEFTYRAISEADLLVFVITNELFDSHLSQHFRKLAIEQDKVHEIMLVINKMQRHSKGNKKEAQDIIIEDIRKVLDPFSPEELRTCFIDAESVNKSIFESDESVAKILLRKSGFEYFIKELNRFVYDKGLNAKYTTSLYSLEQVLQEILAMESTGDKDVDALEELLLQSRRALLETQERIPNSVESEIQKTGTQIRKYGRDIADLIHGNSNQTALEKQLQNAQNETEESSKKLGEAIQKIITVQMKNLDDRIGDIFNSELAKELLPQLENRIKQVNMTPEMTSNLKKVSDISNKLGNFLITNSFNVSKSAGIFKLGQYSGTNAHQVVKTLGNFFGKSFKPWEAVKWARGIANAGRFLAVAGTVLTIFFQIKEDADADQLEKDLRESRFTVRNGFNDAAKAIETHYDKATKQYVETTIKTQIEEVDKQLDELRDMQQTSSQLFRDIISLLEDTRQLVQIIHGKSLDNDFQEDNC